MNRYGFALAAILTLTAAGVVGSRSAVALEAPRTALSASQATSSENPCRAWSTTPGKWGGGIHSKGGTWCHGTGDVITVDVLIIRDGHVVQQAPRNKCIEADYCDQTAFEPVNSGGNQRWCTVTYVWVFPYQGRQVAKDCEHSYF